MKIGNLKLEIDKQKNEEDETVFLSLQFEIYNLKFTIRRAVDQFVFLNRTGGAEAPHA